ncbi:hypothetical protein DXG01_011824 [Tephrocybe rancida]|nr:hypothetical protein DXG01_011824 [Tephrocybe rancida]
MLLATTRHKSVLLLDFLAPSLLSRATLKSLSYNPPGPRPSRTISPFTGTVDKPSDVVPALRVLDAAQRDLLKKGQARLLSACAKSNTREVITALRDLDGRKLLHALPTAHVEASLQLFLKALSTGTLNISDEALCTRFAIQVATSVNPSTDALSTLMLLRLRQKKFPAVVELYGAFMKSLEGKAIWEANEEEEKSFTQGDGLVFDELHRDSPVDPGRTVLLLAVIAAHATQDAFQEALEALLKSAIRIYPTSVDPFLATNFARDEAFAAKFKHFVARLDLARFVSHTTSLTRHIMNLAAERSPQRLEGFYNSIIDGLSGPDAYIAPHPSKKTLKQTVALTEIVWVSFLSSFLKHRRRDLASKVWTDQVSCGVTPGVPFWTALIDAYGSMNEFNDAVASWNMMKAQGIQPDALTYRALISAFFRGRKFPEALKVFQAFQKLPSQDPSNPHVLAVYNTTVAGLLSFNEEVTVQAIIAKMDTHGPKPDLVTYNTLLAYYGRRSNFKALASLIGRMTELKVVGDVYTFSTILSALLRAGRDDAPDLLIDIMRRQGVQPNVATYSAIIDGQMQDPTIQSLNVVMRLLQRMEEDVATQPNVKTYTAILAGLPRIQGADPEQMDEWWMAIVERMKKRRIEPNQVTYHILIGASLRIGSPAGLNRALSYYHHMRERRMMDDSTWYVLLLGLRQRENWQVGEEIIRDMVASGHQPSLKVERLVTTIGLRSLS